MYEYLQDKDFLYSLDSVKIRTTYIKITILDFITEEPYQEIQGIALSGSISVNGSAAIRRTINLSLFADEATNDINNIENLISLKTKVKIEVGLRNPLKSYSRYGSIIWFPQGVFICSSIQFNRSSTGCNISFQGRDKMVLLDGSVGGTLPASTTFHEIYTYDKDNNTTVTYPTIRQIIQEAVEHIGGQPADKIVISDLEDTVKMLVKYKGDTPIWFASDYSSFLIADSPQSGFEKNKYSYGQDVGYQMTDFTYPGELVLNAGATVASLLEKIKSVLGNYEYFFDVDGNFVFQEIKNYLNNSYTPIVNLQEGSYIKNFSDSRYVYSISDAETVTSYQRSPKVTDIKNDFIVWGTRKTALDTEIGIRYHLAVDVKPQIDLANKYMWEISTQHSELGKLVLRYEYTTDSTSPEQGAELIAKPCSEWREELYRQALEKSLSGTTDLYYGEELLSEWRKLFDTMNDEWQKDWQVLFPGESWQGWNPQVFTSPSSLDYWLDFIDSTDALTQFSINVIGRRTKAVNDKDVKTIYNMEVPDIVFIENTGDRVELQKLIDKYNSMGQKYCLLQTNQVSYFSISSTPKSAYDEIRSLIYQHLTYNSTININCQPKYYLQPNNMIYIEDKKSNILGNFIITQFNIPLTYNGTMSLVATEALTRV